MQELKERIQKEGKVLPGNIVKVDGFLNHRVDCQLMAVWPMNSPRSSTSARST